MSANRPVFLELTRIKLPATGIASILHRISGLLLVVTIPVAASLLGLSLSGPEGFALVADWLGHWFATLVLFVLAWSLFHHLLAGIRHLVLDLGLGLERAAARQSAWTVIAAALALVVIGGIAL
ncbi:succinate dehydrogenase, cytochrome b556 subunit [Thioalkalicoccus limnaeus]|uniref:Succinate dehydrogenase cytochrome b556 subunit n=1 Tax=Thioalkalicoccus limnaeus TaxID=120681 RepID=A0ABV4BEE1_9GAMM